MSKRRTHSPEFKARVGMEAISGRNTIQEIAADHAIHPIQVSQWKRQLLDDAEARINPADHGQDRRSLPGGSLQRQPPDGGLPRPEKGFLYLVAIVDLFSRNVLSWKLSNSLGTEFCLQALEMALEGGRKPDIFHSGQGGPIHLWRFRGQAAR